MHACGLSPEVVEFLSVVASVAALPLVDQFLPSLAVSVVSDLHMALDPPQVAGLMTLLPFLSVLNLAWIAIATMVR